MTGGKTSPKARLQRGHQCARGQPIKKRLKEFVTGDSFQLNNFIANSMKWSFNPRHEEPKKFRFTLIAACFIPTLWFISGGTWIESGLALLLLLLTLGPGVWTQNYIIEKGVLYTRLGFLPSKRISLSKVQRFVAMADGVFLSPYKRPSRLDSFHGLFVKANEKRQKDIIALINPGLNT